MKIPSTKEEFLVWPPIGGGIGAFVGTTWFKVFPHYHDLLIQQEGHSFYAGYLFPAAMALVFAVRLHGKYWLGFSWAAFASYFVAVILGLFSPEAGFAASLFMLFACLSILFAVQSLLLYVKRKWWQHET